MGDRLNIIFSRDVILCGWLGSKYQLTNKYDRELNESFQYCLSYLVGLDTRKLLT